MLRPKAIAQVLSQLNTGGIKSTLLLNTDGSLVSFSGGTERDAKVVSAVASNVWFAYERHGRPAAVAAPPGLAAGEMDGGGAGDSDQHRQQTLQTDEAGNPGSVGNEPFPDVPVTDKESLQDLIVECESGLLSVMRVSRMLLCLVAETNEEWGLLKAKTQALREHLEGPLDLVNPVSQQ